MKVLVAMMSHETNTFSPVPTLLERFGGGRPPPEDEAAWSLGQGRASTFAGMLQTAARSGFEVVTPIAAGAPPSGPVDDDAFEYMANRIITSLDGCDAALLELHGAMVTGRFHDGEGELLTRIRQHYPDLPVAVGLDMHANLFPAMVENSTIITGFHTYPHVDMFETGVRAGEILAAMLRGEIHPCMRWGNRPMLPHVMRQGTDDFPNRDLQARAIEMEQDGALAVSLFTGFPHADIFEAGLSVVVVTDNDPDLAEAFREELLDRAWRDREAFVYHRETLQVSVGRANKAADAPGDGPVVLLDHYDNTASGGTMDTTEVLGEIIRQGLEDVAAFGIYDPGVVEQMIDAGVGSEVTVWLGGKMNMPALERQSSPLKVTGIVRAITDGTFTVRGPMATGAQMNMGHTAVLSTGNIDIVVVSRHVEPYDLGCFYSVGINPLEKRFLMLKSRIHYRATFRPVVKEVIECCGVGVCTSDYDQLTFEHVRRPIYPLDLLNTYD